MNFLKKWMGCIISFVAGVCGLALSACTGMRLTSIVSSDAMPALNSSTSKIVKAFKVITDSELYTQAKDLGVTTEFVWLKVFAIITLIISILLIVYSIVLLLKNLNVIKSSHIAFDIVGIVLVLLFVISTIGLMITTNVYANAIESATIDALTAGYTLKLVAMGQPATAISAIKFNVTAKMGVYQPIMLTISIIALILTSTFAFLKRKDA